MILRRCSCGRLHELGHACPVKAELERERWADQSRRRGKRPYDTKRWRQVAQAAKQRDGFRCRARGCGETRGLQAHHIDDDPDRFFELENVVTFCTSHHREAEHRRGQGAGGGREGNRVDYHTSRSPRKKPDDEHVLLAFGKQTRAHGQFGERKSLTRARFSRSRSGPPPRNGR